jgi:uncharacterized protein (DUF58 family)
LKRAIRPAAPNDPADLTLSELLAAQPRHWRGTLAPGQRFPTGMRPGRRRAQGIDLDSIGPYVIGDDVRFMDWRATARTGRAQMKRFVAESHLARVLIVDFRAPMFFATAERPMAKTAALLAARIAWESFGLHEPLGLMVAPDDELIEPRRGRTHVMRIMDHLVGSFARLRASREWVDNASLGDMLETAAGRLARGDEIVLISDFGGPLDALAAAARRLGGARVIRAVVVEDAIFQRPVPPGRYPLRPAELPDRHSAVVSPRGAARHAETVASIRHGVRRALTQAGVHVSVVADAPFLAQGAAR